VLVRLSGLHVAKGKTYRAAVALNVASIPKLHRSLTIVGV